MGNPETETALKAAAIPGERGSRMSLLLPQNNGKWKDSNRPGNTVWFPDLHHTPQGSNDPFSPMTFRQLIMLNFRKPLTLGGISTLKKATVKKNLFLLALGLKGIAFRNGEPVFSPFSIATVKLGVFLDSRYGNKGTMPAADKILAKRLGTSENVVRQWINDNQYVWHERQDGKRIDLLCHDIHGNVPHTGGISRNKVRKEKRGFKRMVL